MGIDQLLCFDQWEQFEQILKKVNIIACSRKNYSWQRLSIPKNLHILIKRFYSNKAVLKTGKNIYYLSLKNMDISSSKVRQLVARGESISHLVPAPVSQGIKKNRLYCHTNRTLKLPNFVHFCARILLDKKAEKN